MDFALENSHQFWSQQARFAARKNRERRCQQGSGPCNIFILDTSSNVGEEGFIQMKETFCTIMNEYAKFPKTDENVTVVICATKNSFSDDVEYGGPCPLTAAFVLSEGAICNGAGYTKVMGHFHLHPRLIFISAGRPTDFTVMNDDESVPIYGPAEKVAAILTSSTSFDGLDKGTFIHLMSRAMPGRKFTERDKDDIFEICSMKSVFKSMDEIRAEHDNKMRSRLVDSGMPPVGSRVKRGPDWKWKNQDQNGPGTVVSHSHDAGWLIVHWDIGTSASYRYGTTNIEKDKYDVVVCLEPRILYNELIAVGCLVKR
ncbi:uncharacterized protein LOC134257818, partial [Saccostrea cucullata]|uniref:uncharacterized protein LOC134257818 n=1 Tax=Saccostrea cuccullata TaxID=36930 RepID=UPI002ED1A0F5